MLVKGLILLYQRFHLMKWYVLDVKPFTWKIEGKLSSVEAWKVCISAKILMSIEHKGGIKVETFSNLMFLWTTDWQM